MISSVVGWFRGTDFVYCSRASILLSSLSLKRESFGGEEQPWHWRITLCQKEVRILFSATLAYSKVREIALHLYRDQSLSLYRNTCLGNKGFNFSWFSEIGILLYSEWRDVSAFVEILICMEQWLCSHTSACWVCENVCIRLWSVGCV